jgi:hypothetical protein
MTLEEAKAIVHSVFPGAYHSGHGSINVIIERKYTPEERSRSDWSTLPTLKALSDNFVISSSWPREIQNQLDTALWVQAAGVVIGVKLGNTYMLDMFNEKRK